MNRDNFFFTKTTRNSKYQTQSKDIFLDRNSKKFVKSSVPFFFLREVEEKQFVKSI